MRLLPAFCLANCCRKRAKGRRPTTTWTTAATVSPAANAPSAMTSMPLNRPMGSASTRRSAATTRRNGAASSSAGFKVRANAVSSRPAGPVVS
ncbi:hypothetical protein D3C73_1165320 [compost metagenome]|jgi:hypothetical protein